MHCIKFESFAKCVYEWKKSICVRVYLFAIYVVIYVYIFMYRRGFFIIQLFRPWLRHNGLQNLIRALHCMVNSNSYVRIHVKIVNLKNQCVVFSILVKKCWSKNWHPSINLGNAQFNRRYLSRKPWAMIFIHNVVKKMHKHNWRHNLNHGNLKV